MSTKVNGHSVFIILYNSVIIINWTLAPKYSTVDLQCNGCPILDVVCTKYCTCRI